MFAAGTSVRLLTRLDAFPPGTIAIVRQVKRDGACVLEFESGVTLEADCAAVTAVGVSNA